MPALDPIRIGDTLKREYRLYNPLPVNQWANPLVPEPDLTSPIDLTGVTITFHIENAGTLRSFTTSAGVTVTPLTGLIQIELETAQTAIFKVDWKAESYVKFVDSTGNVDSRFQFSEKIVRQEDVV